MTALKYRYILGRKRLVVSGPHTLNSMENMHNELNLLKLEDRRNLHFLTECHKNIHNTKSSSSKYFVPVSNLRARQTRNTDALVCMYLTFAPMLDGSHFRILAHSTGTGLLMKTGKLSL